MGVRFEKYLGAVVPALIIGITALLLWSGLTNGHNWGDDFSAYIMQAKSIVQDRPREFIEANRFTIEQSSRPLGPVAYPWGFPVLLAPFYAFFGLNMIALKSVGSVCFLLFLVLLWSGFRKYHSNFWRLVVLCLFALNPTVLRFMDNILSDIPFLLVSTFSVLFIGRTVIERRRLISPVCDQLLLAAAIALAFFIRTNGILLLVTLGITQLIVLIGRDYGHEAPRDQCEPGLMRLLPTKDVFCMNILPYMTFLGFVLAWEAVLPREGSSYGSIVDGLSLGVIKHHVAYYIALPAAFFDGVPHHYLLYGASIPLAIAGAISRYRSDPHMIAYVTLTLLLYILYPPTQGLRYLFPVLPFYISFVVSCLEKYQADNADPAGAVLRKAICTFPVVLVLLYFGKQSASDAFENLIRNRATDSGPFVDTSRSMFSYIEANTAAQSTIVFFKPRAMRMMTGRRSLMINKVADLWRGDYLSLHLRKDGASRSQILPDEVRCLTEKGALQAVYRNGDFVVYRLTGLHNNALHAEDDCAARQPGP